MSSCVYKGERKGDRDCPALGGDICSKCCGRFRLTEIDCPYSCRWLKRGVQRHREKVFDSEKIYNLELMQWAQRRILDGPGPSLPGGKEHFLFLLRLLDLVHHELHRKERPEMHLGVLKDSLRYLEQSRTGTLVSTEEAPSDLARVLESFLERMRGEQARPSIVQQMDEQLLACLKDSIEWCEKRDLSYVEFLGNFFSEYNLPGWQPVKRRGDDFLFPGDEEVPSDGGHEPRQMDDDDLIVPG